MPVFEPDRFNERFTIYLNGDGEPVERRLREMTADEVMAAISWHDYEAERLELEAKPCRLLVNTEAASKLPEGVTRQHLAEAIATTKAYEAALGKSIRLLKLVHANIPAWYEHPNMPIRSAVRRFWPGGR